MKMGENVGWGGREKNRKVEIERNMMKTKTINFGVLHKNYPNISLVNLLRENSDKFISSQKKKRKVTQNKPCRTPCKMSKLVTPPNSLASLRKHAPVDDGL